MGPVHNPVHPSHKIYHQSFGCVTSVHAPLEQAHRHDQSGSDRWVVRRDRRRIVIFDFVICWGTPVLFIGLSELYLVFFPGIAGGRLTDHTVQGRRFDIIQYIGCRATTYVLILGILMICVPPLLLSVGTSAYAGT